MEIFLRVLITVLICSPFNFFTQNLVRDGSFEKTHRLPTKRNNAISCTKTWFCATSDGACDYYHMEGERHAGVPRNIFGRQKPHSGEAYGGMCIRKNFIEYPETKLTDTLEKDQEYLVEFYISRAERSIGKVKSFGVLFLPNIRMGIQGVGIAEVPSVEMVKKRGFRNKKKWMKFSAVYRAEGFERALIIGYFTHDKSIKFRGKTHYYIDDVSVTLITNKEAVPEEIKEKEITEVKSFAPKPGEVVALKNIFFRTNNSELLPESFSELDKLVEYLATSDAIKITFNGHTDNTGNENKNKILSEARAQAVADYLESKGIDRERINYKGYGSSRPVASNENEEGRQKNRRVEFVIE